MANNRRNGIVALGLAGLAYWLFKMKPEEKANLKNKISEYGNKALDKIPSDYKSKLGLNKTEDIHLS